MRSYWMGRFTRIKSDETFWDYQLALLLMSNPHYYCIRPNVNLIQNIGFGRDATHTLDFDPWIEKNVCSEVQFNDPMSCLPLQLSLKEDLFHYLNRFKKKSLAVRLLRKISKLFT